MYYINELFQIFRAEGICIYQASLGKIRIGKLETEKRKDKEHESNSL
jgi:hypothetical protein